MEELRKRIRRLADLLPNAVIGEAVERLEELITDNEGTFSDEVLEAVRAHEEGTDEPFTAEEVWAEVYAERETMKRSRVA